MHCASCAALIKDISSEFPSIRNIDIDVVSKKVTIEHTEEFDAQKWTQEVESLDEKYKVFSL